MTRSHSRTAREAQRSKFGVRIDAVGKAARTIDNITFASQREANRYCELKLLLRAGKIEGLELQPKFPIEIRGQKVCTYIADFRYWERQPSAGKVNLKLHVEDAKGFRTPTYKLKKRLAELLHNTFIEEV